MGLFVYHKQIVTLIMFTSIAKRRIQCSPPNEYQEVSNTTSVTVISERTLILYSYSISESLGRLSADSQCMAI